MALDSYLERIVGRFARQDGEAGSMPNSEPSDEAHSTEALLASAEYELQQVYRDIANVRLVSAAARG